MRQGFSVINVYPFVFDPKRLPVGTQLVGLAFTVQYIDSDAGPVPAIVCKLLEPTKAIDSLTGLTFDVGAGYAVRVPMTAALSVLQQMIYDVPPPGSGVVADPQRRVPAMCFEIHALPDGQRVLVPGHNAQLDTAAPLFTFPTPMPATLHHLPPTAGAVAASAPALFEPLGPAVAAPSAEPAQPVAALPAAP